MSSKFILTRKKTPNPRHTHRHKHPGGLALLVEPLQVGNGASLALKFGKEYSEFRRMLGHLTIASWRLSPPSSSLIFRRLPTIPRHGPHHSE